MAPLTQKLAYPVFLALVAASDARAQEPPAPPREQAEKHSDCSRMLIDAAAALRNEQYPSMAQIAAERQKFCPGPDSLFLVGVAKANMVHNGLIFHEGEKLVRAQAIRALGRALDSNALRSEWLQPANAWLQYLQRAESELAATEAPPPASVTQRPAIIPPAAPPWEPEPSSLGPLLLASAGIGLLGAGLVTAIVASNRGPYEQSSTLDAATNVLLLGGGAALLAALTWHLLTPRPNDTVQVAIAGAGTTTLRLSF